MKKILMTGNEAIARGFYEAGGHVAASYPGSPTVEMLDTLKKLYPEIYAEFSVNEKVALEVGIGSSMVGARTLVSMKHVGVNIAADPLMTFTQMRTIGGFVLMSGDDPGMSSSQNEQDNRLFAKFANMAVFDPSNSQEAKDYTKRALEISEVYKMPVMMRITSRLCHSKSAVTIEERIEKEIVGFERDIANFAMIPPYTFDKQKHMKNRIEALQESLPQLSFNDYERCESATSLVITSGLMYQHLKEVLATSTDVNCCSVLKLGMVYPLPIEAIKVLALKYDRIIVIEEMMPFIEDQLKLEGVPCEGKLFFSYTGELDVVDIRNGLKLAGVLPVENSLEVLENQETSEPSEAVMGRLPMFCSGCPHRPVFDVLKKAKVTVVGDIGCYSMGILYPLEMLDSVISMGASLGMMKGMNKALKIANKQRPLVAVIGDGTFFHSGLTGLINLLHQYEEGDNLTLIILNNGTTAMTGGQPTASSAEYNDGSDLSIKIPQLVEAMGIERFITLDQFNYKKHKKAIEDEIKHPGLSVIMTTRPCALKFKVVNPHFKVDPSICIACRSCVKTNCPPIHMKPYEGFDKEKSSIDPTMCVGCSVCSQVCPVQAIRSSQAPEKTQGGAQ